MTSFRRRWVAVLLTLVIALTIRAPTAAQTPTTTVGVYYVGVEDNVAQAIDRASPYLARVSQPDLAQVIVINNAPLSDTLDAFSGDIQAGRIGLVLFCGPLFPQSTDDLRRLLGISAFLLDQTSAPAMLQTSETADTLQDAIAWQSAPPIQARTVISNPNLLRRVITTASNQGVIQRLRGREQTQVLIVGAWYGHPSNAAQLDWAYYNYLVYRLIADAAGTGRILSYADYPPAPTPQRTERWAIAGVGVGLLLGTAGVLYLARRRLYLQPSQSASLLRLAAISEPAVNAAKWRQAGFHRPLAGFLAYLPWSLLLLAPSFAYTLHILPTILMPEAQGWETWNAVGRWTLVIWTLVDAGTGVAAVHFFSVYQTHYPQRAWKAMQFYTWWQLLSGTVQVSLTCIAIAAFLPGLGLAHLAYYLLAHAALQFPGFLAIFTLTFRARQRFDHEQLMNIIVSLITIGLQVGFVLILRPWGATRVDVGVGLAGNIGLAAGIAGAQMAAFLVGAYLHRRDGLALGAVFLPTFDSGTAGEVLKFGVPWALGAAIPAAGLFVQATVLRGSNLTSELAPSGLPTLLLIAASFEILLTGLYQGLMPALTEARVAGYGTLLRYYISQSIRYGAWFGFFLFGALAALSKPLFSAVLGPQYTSVAPWIVPMLACGALSWLAWLPDRMLEAAGRPGLIALLALVEQVLRLGGIWVGWRLWGMDGVLLAYATALLIRALLGRLSAGRALIRARLYIWQTLIAPATSGLAIYVILRAITAPWQDALPNERIIWTSGVLFPALLTYGLLTALLGGWDDGAVDELRQSVVISGAGYPFAWLLLQGVRLGARISPLHGRFPMGLRPLAQEEAQALTFAQSPTE